MNAGAAVPPAPVPPPARDEADPEPLPATPRDPEKGRVPPVTVPGKSDHPQQ